MVRTFSFALSVRLLSVSLSMIDFINSMTHSKQLAEKTFHCFCRLSNKLSSSITIITSSSSSSSLRRKCRPIISASVVLPVCSMAKIRAIRSRTRPSSSYWLTFGWKVLLNEQENENSPNSYVILLLFYSEDYLTRRNIVKVHFCVPKDSRCEWKWRRDLHNLIITKQNGLFLFTFGKRSLLPPRAGPWGWNWD